MKIRAEVFVVLLLLATLAAESDAISGPVQGKRELKDKVRQLLSINMYMTFILSRHESFDLRSVLS